MEGFYNIVSLAVFIPMVGLVINLFMGKSLGERGVAIVAVGASTFAFIVSLLLWATLVDNHYEAAIVDAPLISSWIYIPSAAVDIPWQFRVDTLSVTMMLVVTGVGTLIHLYAVGYMHGDERFPRFFVYLNLFLVFMLILVTGNNFLMMFVGWEGVGLCSFLLIGFWFDKRQKHDTEGTLGWSNSNAARKAFIVNRIGDFGLLIGMFLTFWTFGTLDYYKPNEEIHIHFEEGPAPVFQVEEEAHGQTEAHDIGVFTQAETWFHDGDHEVEFGSISLPFETVVTLITLLFLLGAAGKSAQIPLFVWLPDAMAGPTPVSALIHAATMVTAGVYMMVRSNSLFYNSELTSLIVAIVGCTTALVAGFMALGQWDIKKVLAYSTVSQLGFMVAAVGIGAYAAAMFHLVTHAFFKALLFLGSGSVIHGVEHGHHHAHHGHDDHDEAFDPQDMRNMGGLSKKMPITYWTYMVGALALAGLIPFAGFWSKDEILADAFTVWFDEGELRGTLALFFLFVAAGFTAFYIWRQVSMIFFGQARTEAAEHASESTWTMTLPLVLLATGSTIIGFINIPSGVPLLGSLFGGEHRFTEFLEESVIHAHAGSFNWPLAIVATGLAIGAIYLARTIYNDRVLENLDQDPLEREASTAAIFGWSNARLYWDEAYFMFIVYPFQRAARFLAHTLDWKLWHDFFHENIVFRGFQGMADLISQPIDKQVVDRGFLSLGYGARRLGNSLRRTQTGYVRTYALSVLMGALLVIVIILLPVLRDLLGI